MPPTPHPAPVPGARRAARIAVAPGPAAATGPIPAALVTDGPAATADPVIKSARDKPGSDDTKLLEAAEGTTTPDVAIGEVSDERAGRHGG
ncbi:hypothetical protein P9869_01905 [Streptomyces ossamyceticus]|nr:hypothetical protein [Streptomyces ossamyceticus]